MIDKIEFEVEILKVLKKYGYKIEGIKELNLKLNDTEIPEIEIEYFII